MNAVPARPSYRSRSRERLVRGALITAALVYVLVLLVAPLAGIVYYALKAGVGEIGTTFSQPDVRHAFYLTAIIMIVTVIVTTVFGVIVALVLARDSFPGKALVSAFVDLPLAVSPVIVGLMAVLLFGRGGWFEPFFAAQGIQVVYALPSMILVTIFIAIPFVIREVVPVLEELGTEEEQAAWTLGASRWQTFRRVTLPLVVRAVQPVLLELDLAEEEAARVLGAGSWTTFRKVVLPALRPAITAGALLVFARSMGEFGAIVFVSGNIPNQTLTAPVLISQLLNPTNYGASGGPAQAAAVSALLFGFSFIVVLVTERLSSRSSGWFFS